VGRGSGPLTQADLRLINVAQTTLGVVL
jgi:hypothetical protein